MGFEKGFLEFDVGDEDEKDNNKKNYNKVDFSSLNDLDFQTNKPLVNEFDFMDIGDNGRIQEENSSDSDAKYSSDDEVEDEFGFSNKNIKKTAPPQKQQQTDELDDFLSF